MSKLFGGLLALLFVQTWTLPPKNDIQPTPLITNGQDATSGQFPHHASIVVKRPLLKDEVKCGGSILNDRWILTSAQCAQTKAILGKLRIKVGQQSRTQDNEYVQTRDIVLIIVHKDYEIGLPLLRIKQNDIALIKLSSPLTLNKRVKSLLLPKSTCKPKGRALLSGFGAKSILIIPHYPEVLQYANVSVISQGNCQDAIRTISVINKDRLTDKQLCTGPLDDTITACLGDSGNPLVLRTKKNHTIQIGILSWGALPCGQVGSPIVYTRVAEYVDWIKARINEN